MSSSILDRRQRLGLDSVLHLNSTQITQQQILHQAQESLGEVSNLAAMTLGSLAFRFTRLGFLRSVSSSSLPRFIPQTFLHGSSYTLALSAEVTAFRGVHDALTRLKGQAPLQNIFDANGWRGTFVDFAALKLLSPLGKYNPLLANFSQSNAMVLGHELSAQLGFSNHESGTYTERLAKAQMTAMQLGASLGLFHISTGGRVRMLESSLDLKTQVNEKANTESFLRKREREFLPVMKSHGEDARSSHSYQLGTALVLDKLRALDPAAADQITQLDPRDILVVRGEHDHMNNILDLAQIPYTLLERDLMIPGSLLNSARAVFVNCGADFMANNAGAIARRVEAGALVLSTDWSLHNLLEVAFPGFVRWTRTQTGHEVIPAKLEIEDPLLSGLFAAQAEPRWVVAGASYPMEVLNREAVQTVVSTTHSSLSRDGQKAPVVVRFPFGRGGVYHMVSHFYIQGAHQEEGVQAGSAESYTNTVGAGRNTATILGTLGSQGGVRTTFGGVQSAATSAALVATLLRDSLRGGSQSWSASQTATPTILAELPPEAKWLYQNTSHWNWNVSKGLAEYRMPADINSVVLGRNHTEVNEPLLTQDRSVSRKHLSITREGEVYRLRVLSSHTPIQIITREEMTMTIAPGGQAYLLPGQRIRIIGLKNFEFIFNPE